MKKILFLIFPLLLAVSVSAQEKCQLPFSSAPLIFNLKLGMNGTEAKRALGGKLNIKNKKKGSYFQNFIKKSPPKTLPGVRAIYLRFFDSKLFQIEIFYEKESKNLTLAEFIKDFSTRENLPLESWKTEYGIARLECAGFSLAADNFLNPRIELTDEVVHAEFAESQKKDD